MKATCCVTHIRGIPAAEYKGANDCEHCRQRPETDSVDMIIGLRRVVQQYQYYCGLEYELETCPLVARACRMKIEFDGNDNDIRSIAMLEFGTHDIKFNFDNEGDEGISDDGYLDNDYGDEDP